MARSEEAAVKRQSRLLVVVIIIWLLVLGGVWWLWRWMPQFQVITNLDETPESAQHENTRGRPPEK